MEASNETAPLPVNPVLKALVDAAGEVGKTAGLNISVTVDDRSAMIVVDRAGEPRGDLCLGTALEVVAAAHVAYARAIATATTAELVLTLHNVRLIEQEPAA
jgi:hypothetical protein